VFGPSHGRNLHGRGQRGHRASQLDLRPLGSSTGSAERPSGRRAVRAGVWVNTFLVRDLGAVRQDRHRDRPRGRLRPRLPT
jgi:hypothetical protein